MSDQPYEPRVLNGEQLPPADTLDGTDMRADALDAGYTAPEHYLVVDRSGEPESLDERLAEELSDLPEPGDPDRAGRLVAPGEGAHANLENEMLAADVGGDAGDASAEEAAMHWVDEP